MNNSHYDTDNNNSSQLLSIDSNQPLTKVNPANISDSQSIQTPSQPQATSLGDNGHSQQIVLVKSGRNDLAIASLVLGIVALLGAWIPIFNVISLIIGTIGIILGTLATSLAFTRKSSKIIAILGMIFNALSVTMFFVVGMMAGRTASF